MKTILVPNADDNLTQSEVRSAAERIITADIFAAEELVSLRGVKMQTVASIELI
jgi:hypothetical protein